jgi:hypothetical protein
MDIRIAIQTLHERCLKGLNLRVSMVDPEVVSRRHLWLVDVHDLRTAVSKLPVVACTLRNSTEVLLPICILKTNQWERDWSPYHRTGYPKFAEV